MAVEQCILKTYVVFLTQRHMLFFHVLFSNFYSVIDGMTVEAYQSALTLDVTAVIPPSIATNCP